MMHMLVKSHIAIIEFNTAIKNMDNRITDSDENKIVVEANHF